MRYVFPGFTDSLQRGERIAGLVYLPIHIFVLPLALGLLGALAQNGVIFSGYMARVSDVEGTITLFTNAAYYALGFFFCLLFMLRFLRRSFDLLLDNVLRCIFSMIGAYIVYYVLSLLLSFVLISILGEAAYQNPNDDTISSSLSSVGLGPMFGIAALVAPVVEEVLFRGVLFGSIYQKSRFWAYTVSILVFGIYHVWQYALLGLNWMLLVYIVQYIPTGFALARCYERTSSIWPPIFLHMINNAVALMAL